MQNDREPRFRMAHSRTLSNLSAVAILTCISAAGMARAIAQTAPEQGARPAPPVPEHATLPHYFPAGAVWTQDVSQAPVDPQSASMIDWLAGAGGWGTGKLRVDFSIRVLQADASTPLVPFRKAADFYAQDSDVPPKVPLPVGGGMEAEPGYDCPNTQDDCHFIVVDRSHAKLYEAWQANYSKGAFTASSFAIWDLNRVYLLRVAGTSVAVRTPQDSRLRPSCSTRTNLRLEALITRSVSPCRSGEFGPESLCILPLTPAALRDLTPLLRMAPGSD